MVNRYGYSLDHHSALTIQFNTIACHSISYQTAKYLLEKSYIYVFCICMSPESQRWESRGGKYPKASSSRGLIGARCRGLKSYSQ